MRKALHYILLAVLTAVPMGLQGVSSCDFSTLLALNAHHHEGSFGTSLLCIEPAGENHEDSALPCDEGCLLKLPDASLARTSLRAPQPPALTLAQWGLLPIAGRLPAVHVATMHHPPDASRRPPSPVFTGCFLI